MKRYIYQLTTTERRRVAIWADDEEEAVSQLEHKLRNVDNWVVDDVEVEEVPEDAN